MKNTFILTLAVLFSMQLYGQKNKFYFNEMTLSINKTRQQDYNTEDGQGMGVGVYHFYRAEKRTNVIWGLEFNRTNQFKKSIPQGHFSGLEGVYYSISSFSIPIKGRISLGQKVKIFTELGGHIGINISITESGKSYYYDSISGVKVVTKFKNKRGAFTRNYGYLFGFGVEVPFKEYSIVLKVDYKHGIRNMLYNGNDLMNRYVRIVFGVKM